MSCTKEACSNVVENTTAENCKAAAETFFGQALRKTRVVIKTQAVFRSAHLKAFF